MIRFSLFLKEAEADDSLTLYHGSMNPNLSHADLHYAHLGTHAAATQRLADIQQGLKDSPDSFKHHIANGNSPTIYKVKFNPGKSINLPDEGDWTDADVAHHMHKQGVIDHKEFNAIFNGEKDAHDVLREKGYHSVNYKNEWEDKGSTSHYALHPGRVHILGKESS